MLDRDLQDPQITAIEQTGYPIQHRVKSTFKPELIEVVEYDKNNDKESTYE